MLVALMVCSPLDLSSERMYTVLRFEDEVRGERDHARWKEGFLAARKLPYVLNGDVRLQRVTIHNCDSFLGAWCSS